jgi:hypothetical protein
LPVTIAGFLLALSHTLGGRTVAILIEDATPVDLQRTPR